MFEILKRRKSLETKQTELCLLTTFLIFDTGHGCGEKFYTNLLVMHSRMFELDKALQNFNSEKLFGPCRWIVFVNRGTEMLSRMKCTFQC